MGYEEKATSLGGRGFCRLGNVSRIFIFTFAAPLCFDLVRKARLASTLGAVSLQLSECQAWGFQPLRKFSADSGALFSGIRE